MIGAVAPEPLETRECIDQAAQTFPSAGLDVEEQRHAARAVVPRYPGGDDQGLLPLREFRFNDHLVWLFVGGLVLVLMGGEGLDRAGSNAVVFMSGLYALRGAAVVAFFGAGKSLLSVVFLVLALLFVWPVVAIGALVIGLGDTWLDLRARARAMTA